MGHGYAHANAGKPINWYDHKIYSATRCEDVTDPLQNPFSMKNIGRGYDVDGIFEYGQGDALTDKEFKFHAVRPAPHLYDSFSSSPKPLLALLTQTDWLQWKLDVAPYLGVLYSA